MKVSFCRKEDGSPFIGVLALQGNYRTHIDHLAKLGVNSAEIINISQLDDIDGLVIPGGESTTLLKFFEREPWEQAIRDFSAERPIFGTCAGTILLAKYVENPVQRSLGLVPVRIIRNGYGRQKESFYAELFSDTFPDAPVKGYFIRAPIIKDILDSETEVLAWLDNHPVLIRYGNILCSTFHPELSDDLRVHQLFTSTCKCRCMLKCMNLV